MLRIVFAYMLALAAAQDTTTDAPDTTTDAATTTIAATTAQGNLGGVVATTTEAAADTTTAAVTTTTTTTTTTTPSTGASITLPVYTNAAVVTQTVATVVQVCADGAVAPADDANVKDTTQLTKKLQDYIKTQVNCASAFTATTDSCDVATTESSSLSFYCPSDTDEPIQVDVTLVMVVTLGSTPIDAIVAVLNDVDFEAAVKTHMDAVSGITVEVNPVEAASRTDITKEQLITADFSYCVSGATSGGVAPLPIHDIASVAAVIASTSFCTGKPEGCAVTTPTDSTTCATESDKLVAVKVQYTAVVTNGLIAVRDTVSSFSDARVEAIGDVADEDSSGRLIATLVPLEAGANFKWTFAAEDITYVKTATVKSSVKACVAGADTAEKIVAVRLVLVSTVKVKVCDNTALDNVANVCTVVAAVADHPCDGGRRGRQLTAETAFQADVTLVADVTASDDTTSLTTVTDIMESTDASTGLAALVDSAIEGDETGTFVSTVTAVYVDTQTVDDTPSSTTTSGAATMFVGHIGALLVTYLYVSL